MTKTKTLLMQTLRFVRDADVRLTEATLEILADIIIEQMNEEPGMEPAPPAL